ncbi:hypothetical protein [Sporosarcina sp. E16_8]|uniref:hypothetical protein n=1 Tax=Sporosarcina sp. E16_8 TaxID=2789295 RepID=UPI001A91F90F|nr:hypothetical protein [Sporosarcina sp. E16_8]MBO0589710.1 hypothetical protein [Sporosarcina sp. E16_8]
MHCVNCGHQQSEGKFCAICGKALGDNLLTRSRSAGKSGLQSTKYIEKVKDASNKYWNYFLNYLKHPSLALKQGEKEFSNGLITSVIMAFIIGLVLFTFMKRVPSPFLDASYELSFTSVIGSSLLFVFISTVIIIASLFLTIKYLGSEHSFKSIAGIYGTQLIPSTFLVLISFILLLLKAYTYSNFLLSFALLLAFFVVPLYILIKLLTKEEAGIDPLYCVIAYIVVFGIAFSIYLYLLEGSLILDLLIRRMTVT